MGRAETELPPAYHRIQERINETNRRLALARLYYTFEPAVVIERPVEPRTCRCALCISRLEEP